MNINLIGRILVSFAIITIMAGIYIYTDKPKIVYKEKQVEKALTEIEATEVFTEKIKSAIKLYENPQTYFKVDTTTETHIKVENYDEVVKKLYTDNGKKEIDTFTFNKEKYVIRDETGIYLLKNIPKDKLHKDEKIAMKDYKLYISKMAVNVTFENTYIDDSGTLNVVLKTIPLILIKENNTWLIDSLNLNYL